MRIRRPAEAARRSLSLLLTLLGTAARRLDRATRCNVCCCDRCVRARVRNRSSGGGVRGGAEQIFGRTFGITMLRRER